MSQFLPAGSCFKNEVNNQASSKIYFQLLELVISFFRMWFENTHQKMGESKSS